VRRERQEATLQGTESGADFSWESGDEIDGICHSISSRC